MIKKGWARTYINSQVDRVRRMFRWAEEELLPGSVHDNLAKMTSLRKGKCEARESEKVRPVPDEIVDATLPYLHMIPRAMVELQRLTGMRPGEVCRMRDKLHPRISGIGCERFQMGHATAGLEHLQRHPEGDVQVQAAELGERHFHRLQEGERLSVEVLGGEAGGGAAGGVHGVVLPS